MRKGTGAFTENDEENTKRLREAEAIVRKEKAAAAKKSSTTSKSYPKGPVNNKRSYDYVSYGKRFQPADYYNQYFSYYSKFENQGRHDFEDRKFVENKVDRGKGKNPNITCYRCWGKGHIAANCTKKPI